MNIIRFPSLASTNDTLISLAKDGAENGTVVTAKFQTNGRGTKGRRFFSPEGGLYMSVLLKNVKKDCAPHVTPMAAVAVRQAIIDVCGIETKIKPVNDLYLNGKKVCGILTQALSPGGNISFIVVGIGVDLFEPEGGFPEEIKPIAASLITEFDEMLMNKLTVNIAEYLLDGATLLADEEKRDEMYDAYRRFSINE